MASASEHLSELLRAYLAKPRGQRAKQYSAVLSFVFERAQELAHELTQGACGASVTIELATQALAPTHGQPDTCACGGASEIITTRNYGRGKHLRTRTRKCAQCGLRWRTYEVRGRQLRRTRHGTTYECTALTESAEVHPLAWDRLKASGESQTTAAIVPPTNGPTGSTQKD